MKTDYFAAGLLMAAVLGGMVSCATVREDALSKEQAPAQYVIGPEDVLDVYVWKEDTLSRTVMVRIDGKISLPLINEVQAAGLTPLQLKEELTQKFREYVDIPNVSVMVVGANSSRVTISGRRVNQIVPFRSPISMLQLMIIAGGTDSKRILVIRNEGGKEKRYTMDYQKIVKGTEPDFMLKSGDTVIIESETTAWSGILPSGTPPSWATPPMPNPLAPPPSWTSPSVAPPSGAPSGTSPSGTTPSGASPGASPSGASPSGTTR